MKNAIIENIDAKLLEQQKIALLFVIENCNIPDTEKEALEGIFNLLDHITDEIDKGKIPNGWNSFIETHHEICYKMAILDQNDDSPVITDVNETAGIV